MSATKPMRSLRRPMPGMPAAPTQPDHEPPVTPAEPVGEKRRRAEHVDGPATSRPCRQSERGRWAAADYSATRLANFRLPVDLHDRYRELVRETAVRHPRLRRASLTELVIALLEEGPRTPDEAAELIRRKRAAENAQEPPR